MRRRCLAAVALALGLVGCSAVDDGPGAAATSDPAGPVAGKADASDSDSVIASVWDQVDYLPWEYAPDGCFARSYYVAMEMVSRDIPVSQMVINLLWEDTPTNHPRFSPVDGRDPELPPVTYRGTVVQWDYHIAALLLPPVVEEPMIFDRAMEPGLVPVDTWVGDANSAGLPRSELTADGTLTAGFNEFSTFGSSYLGLSPSLTENWASVSSPTLDSLPPFQESVVQLACNTVRTIYDCMATPSDDARRTRLVRRTNELLAELAGHGHLTGWDGRRITCGPTPFACAAL